MDYKELIIWQKAFNLTFEIYKLTENLPEDEKYGLSSQIKRSAVSIPSNIAEGYGRISKKYFQSFLKIALGSTLELETQVLLGEKLNFFKGEGVNKILKTTLEIRKIIGKLIYKK